jgi:hypothetical protein
VQQLARDIVNAELSSAGSVRIGLIWHGDHSVITQEQVTLRHHETLDRVAVEVGVLVDGDLRFSCPGLADELVAGIGARADLDRRDGRSADVVFELAADP